MFPREFSTVSYLVVGQYAGHNNRFTLQISAIRNFAKKEPVTSGTFSKERLSQKH